MGRLITSDGGPLKRLADYIVYCGRCFEEFERTATGATVCPNGCPP